jgi:hypothetical protein
MSDPAKKLNLAHQVCRALQAGESTAQVEQRVIPLTPYGIYGIAGPREQDRFVSNAQLAYPNCAEK